MMNIGVRPTLTLGNRRQIEVHLFDFTGDLYGETLTVEFVARIRNESRFASKDELIAQLTEDEANCRPLVQS